MKIKEISFAYKKGLPSYSSASTNVIATIEPGDDLDEVWDNIKQEAQNNCNLDPKWIDKKDENSN